MSIAAAVVALLVPVSAHAASAGVNIAGVPDANGPAISNAIASGAQYVRLFLLWHDAEPSSKGSYDNNLLASYNQTLNKLNAAGVKVVFVVTSAPQWASGSTDSAVPPRHASDYGDFVGAMANKFAGKVAAWEVWNEEDETGFWHPTPDAATYVGLLRAAYPAVKAQDPAAQVLMGPLVGNDYDFLSQVYAAGGKGSFDGVSVHTDTACLVDGPDSFYRDNGHLARYTFLGYREVHQTMVANGDGDKPIWMTELGWSSTTSTCQRGTFAGQKPAGVTPAQQATFLSQAFHCMAADPYLQVAIWFTEQDDPSQATDELRHYGLLDSSWVPKPAFTAFRNFTLSGDQLTGPCGDFDPPAIKVMAPAANQQFVGSLKIEASASDGGVGLARITFRADGKSDEIVNFTTDLANDKPVVLDWQGAKKLANGKHTIAIEAIDKNGNLASSTVSVTKVRSLAATMATKSTLYRVRCKGRKCVLRGKIAGPAGYSVGGKVKAFWQWSKSKKGRYKTLHKGLRNANKPFTFTQRLKRAGFWRVQVRYLGQAPLKGSASKYLYFRVR